MKLAFLILKYGIFLAVGFFLFGCAEPKTEDLTGNFKNQSKNSFLVKDNFPEVKKLNEFPNTEFLPTLEQSFKETKNAIYASTLKFCWDEIKNEIGGGAINIDKSYKV